MVALVFGVPTIACAEAKAKASPAICLHQSIASRSPRAANLAFIDGKRVTRNYCAPALTNVPRGLGGVADAARPSPGAARARQTLVVRNPDRHRFGARDRR